MMVQSTLLDHAYIYMQVLVNGEPGASFLHHRGLRQAEPPPPGNVFYLGNGCSKFMDLPPANNFYSLSNRSVTTHP